MGVGGGAGSLSRQHPQPTPHWYLAQDPFPIPNGSQVRGQP
jgi:hypothetical protein